MTDFGNKVSNPQEFRYHSRICHLEFFCNLFRGGTLLDGFCAEFAYLDRRKRPPSAGRLPDREEQFLKFSRCDSREHVIPLFFTVHVTVLLQAGFDEPFHGTLLICVLIFRILAQWLRQGFAQHELQL